MSTSTGVLNLICSPDIDTVSVSVLESCGIELSLHDINLTSRCSCALL